MFTQKCFIRKNTPEIRKRLDEIGRAFIENGHGEWRIHVDKNEYLFCGDEQFCDGRIYFYIGRVCKPIEGIDCGTNEELFLAIAALRDDSDKFQWFVMDAEIYTEISEGDWFIATDIKGGKHVGTQIDPLYCHKATVQELIEHFKNKL